MLLLFIPMSFPQATEMIDAIRTAFKRNLPNLKWMDEKTRKAAEDKVDPTRMCQAISNYHNLDNIQTEFEQVSSESLKLFCLQQLYALLSLQSVMFLMTNAQWCFFF